VIPPVITPPASGNFAAIAPMATPDAFAILPVVELNTMISESATPLAVLVSSSFTALVFAEPAMFTAFAIELPFMSIEPVIEPPASGNLVAIAPMVIPDVLIILPVVVSKIAMSESATTVDELETAGTPLIRVVVAPKFISLEVPKSIKLPTPANFESSLSVIDELRTASPDVPLYLNNALFAEPAGPEILPPDDTGGFKAV
jgi:hypothetical protein